MATGDDAIAAGMANVNGATTPANTIDTELMLTRDYIAQGKGATDAATASKVMKRDAFGRAKVATPSAASDIATKGYVDAAGVSAPTPNTPAKRDAAGRAQFATPSASADAATKGWAERVLVRNGSAGTNALELRWSSGHFQQYVDGSYQGQIATHADMASAIGGKVDRAGDTMTGNLYLPNATAATSGYTIAYINGDGRVSKGASSERFKHDIVRSPELPDVFAVDSASFVMDGDEDETPRYGRIAEDLARNPATEAFVVYDSEGRAESFDMVSYLFAAVDTLHRRVQELEADR